MHHYSRFLHNLRRVIWLLPDTFPSLCDVDPNHNVFFSPRFIAPFVLLWRWSFARLLDRVFGVIVWQTRKKAPVFIVSLISLVCARTYGVLRTKLDLYIEEIVTSAADWSYSICKRSLGLQAKAIKNFKRLFQPLQSYCIWTERHSFIRVHGYMRNWFEVQTLGKHEL